MMHEHDNTLAPDAGMSPTQTPTVRDRSAWEVIEEVCAQRLSGELTMMTSAPTATRVYMNNGLVYFAEQDGDDTLAARLVISGALDDEQLRRGAIRLNGVEHLGRLFERDDTVDRDAVELAIELITEMTLSDVAEQPVRSFRTTMYRHHPSGINRWFSSQQTMDDEPVTGSLGIISQATAAQSRPLVAPETEPSVAALEATPEDLLDVPVEGPVDVPVDIQAEVPVDEPVEQPLAPLEKISFVESAPVVQPEIQSSALLFTQKAEPYRAALDLSDLVAAMGVGAGRSPNPVDDDRPVVKARMWAPSITPPEPVEPPPAVPEPFHREVDPELESLIASLVPTAPSMPVQVLTTSAPPLAHAENVVVASAAHDDHDHPGDGDGDGDGVEWFAMPATPADEVTAEIILIDGDPAVAIEPEPQPLAMPVLSVDSLVLPTLPQFTLPIAGARLGALSSLAPLAPIAVSVTPAPMVPVASSAPLATVHPIRDMPFTPAPFDPEQEPWPQVHVIPELGSIPVPEDVAAAVRRAISAIEAATTSTGPLPVTFGPLHVTSFAQQPVFVPVPDPIAAASAPVIQPVHNDDGGVVPLMSLNGHATPPETHEAPAPSSIPISAATMAFPEIEFPELPPAEELLNNPQPAPISNQRRGALRRLIDGIRRR